MMIRNKASQVCSMIKTYLGWANHFVFSEILTNNLNFQSTNVKNISKMYI